MLTQVLYSAFSVSISCLWWRMLGAISRFAFCSSEAQIPPGSAVRTRFYLCNCTYPFKVRSPDTY